MMQPYYEDKWVKIYHGDCREILPQLDVKVDLVLTDPPYGIKRFQKGFGYTRFHGYGVERHGISWDTPPDKQLLELILTLAKESIIWGYNNLELPKSEHFLVWDKVQTVDNFASVELAYCNLKTPAKVCRYSIHKHNVAKNGGHPTEKPIYLMKWCILQADEPQLVLDPFMGSGTTLFAAKQLNRYSIGIEIEEKYCEIAARRCCQEVLELV